MSRLGKGRRIKKTTGFYKSAVRLIRKYAHGFDAGDGYDLRKADHFTPAQKAQISRYFDAIDKLTARPYQVYRPRNRKHLEQLQRAGQHIDHLPKLDVAFIPGTPNQRAKIEYDRKGNVKLRMPGGVTKELVYIDPNDLIYDTDNAIQEAVESVPHARRFKIMCGEYENKIGTFSGSGVQEQVKRLMGRYDSDRFDPDDSNSHYFGNWLQGIIAYSYEENDDFQDFMREMNRAKEEMRNERKLLRDRYYKQQQRKQAKARSEASRKGWETRKGK